MSQVLDFAFAVSDCGVPYGAKDRWHIDGDILEFRGDEQTYALPYEDALRAVRTLDPSCGLRHVERALREAIDAAERDDDAY